MPVFTPSEALLFASPTTGLGVLASAQSPTRAVLASRHARSAIAQLSYAHPCHACLHAIHGAAFCSNGGQPRCGNSTRFETAPTCTLARPEGLEPSTLGLAYQLLLSQPEPTTPASVSQRSTHSLWSGLSLHRLRCCTYSLYGTPRIQRVFEAVSTPLPFSSVA